MKNNVELRMPKYTKYIQNKSPKKACQEPVCPIYIDWYLIQIYKWPGVWNAKYERIFKVKTEAVQSDAHRGMREGLT